jgi:hypothetical protein
LPTSEGVAVIGLAPSPSTGTGYPDRSPVKGQDLLLAEVLFQLDRHQHLFDLAPPFPLAGEKEAAGELHRDRRRALDDPTGTQVDHRRAHDPRGVDAAVLEEVAVLGGEQSLADERRNLPLLEHQATLAGEVRKGLRCQAADASEGRRLRDQPVAGR